MNVLRKITPRRWGALFVRWTATQGSLVWGVLLAACLAWSAYIGWHNGSNTALDYAARVLSILSVGRLTDKINHPLLAGWELAIAFAILVPALARLALWLTWPRLVIAILPLFMIGGDLPSSGEQTALLYASLLGASIILASQRRWAQLEKDPRTSELVASRELTPQQRALRRKRLITGLAVVLVVGGVGRAAWPSYLRWFHARQEAAVFDEKLAGKLVAKSMPVSRILHRKITTWVYLPPGYDRLNIRYPVVYVMHGMPGEVRDCFVKGQIHNAAEQLILSRKIGSMILVGWDGEGPNGPSDVTDFLDRADGSWQMESFIVKELVPYIDRTYRTIARPEARALCGVSAGGYAAVNLLFRHPDVWKIGASHTGFFDPKDDSEYINDILGTQSSLWDENNPMKTVPHVTPSEDLHVYADIGQGDELSAEFSQFCSLLDAQKIDHVCHVFPGRHTWQYWSTHFYDSLQFIDSRFKKMVVRD